MISGREIAISGREVWGFVSVLGVKSLVLGSGDCDLGSGDCDLGSGDCYLGSGLGIVRVLHSVACSDLELGSRVGRL